MLMERFRSCRSKPSKPATNHLQKAIRTTAAGMPIALLLICILAGGCTLIKSKIDEKKHHESTVIVGRVGAEFEGKGPIVVAVRKMNQEEEDFQYTVLHSSGEYELMVDQGEYYIFAYLDKDGDLIYEAGEPAGQHNNPKIISVPAFGVVHDVDIFIPEKGAKIEIPYGTEISSVKPDVLHSRQAGDITDLEDARFSEENGKKGFWEPSSFFKALGGNIYFLEEYDPEKTPVLFIHGAGGTPRGWRYFVEHMDRTRFQPWFFYYPTGARIDSIAYLLFWKLLNLQSKYQFYKIYITAHSMGGLVARSFLVNYGMQFPYVKLLITLATPWGGDRMAEYGVQQSPVVIPSWIDMQPEGDFIKSLYRMKLPEYVQFYMFYGYKGNRSPFTSNNDGTITLSSLLDFRPQSEAKMNYAFNEDHASIVFSKEVLAQYNAILDEQNEKSNKSPHRSTGHLKIHFAYDYDVRGVIPRPKLILTPNEGKGAEAVIFLNDDDNGRILGPFPAGDYLASLVTTATAGKPNQKHVPVSVGNNETSELDFVFEPDGVIFGCVKTAQDSEYNAAGMPEYLYRSDERRIHIESVALKGNGIDRTLKPLRNAYMDDTDFIIARADACYNEFFVFFGLPAGDYTLTIKARGYKRLEKSVSVVPGMLDYLQGIELTPD